MVRWIKNLGHFANALLANIFYGFPSRKLTIIGVTGTDGKTTTATLIYHILNTAHQKVALISTVSAKIGAEDIDTGFHVTTPNPWSLQRLIKKIAAQNYQYLVLEATSHGLDQHRLLGINFHIGVLTNITHEHLDYHKTYDNYLHAKAKLFAHSHHAVLNQNDPSFSPVKKLLPPFVMVHSYSLSTVDRSLLAIVQKRFPEQYNWSNALAATQAATILAIQPSIIYRAITTFTSVKGRMEEIKNSHGIQVFVDFAHTPNALKSALEALKQQKTKDQKLIAVYGSAGLRDASKRPMMGEVGSRLADMVVLTAEDPRTEDVNNIINQMAQGCQAAGATEPSIKESPFSKKETPFKSIFFRVPDRQAAINLAIVKLAHKGDIVGVFGKGHERSMCFGTIEYPWSDHDAVKQSLKKRH